MISVDETHRLDGGTLHARRSRIRGGAPGRRVALACRPTEDRGLSPGGGAPRPKGGGVGARGDLAPLAHLALALIGEGEVLYRGKRMPAVKGLAAARLHSVVLEAKEGLALINGVQMSGAVGGPAAG